MDRWLFEVRARWTVEENAPHEIRTNQLMQNPEQAYADGINSPNSS